MDKFHIDAVCNQTVTLMSLDYFRQMTFWGCLVVHLSIESHCMCKCYYNLTVSVCEIVYKVKSGKVCSERLCSACRAHCMKKVQFLALGVSVAPAQES